MRRARLLMFWDYDTQWGADRSRSPGGPKGWGPLEFPHTELLLELHARHAIPACFAVVGAAALPGIRPYHDPAQVRRIHLLGHEIASHTFRHDWIPGLSPDDLRETLRSSKQALEQCIGAPVTSFVPPWNQPFDYPAGLSFSLSERREAGRAHIHLGMLCRALRETGYRFCRVSYRPLHVRIAQRILNRRIDRPARLESIAGITCVRLNTPGGFDAPAREMLRRCAAEGGVVVVYGHPHSIRGGSAQDLAHLQSFLSEAGRLRDEGRLEVTLPSRLHVHPAETN
ncbi:MAG: polysaccharide deacetylase family protein [Planctomycetaceae bacterium]